MAYTAASATVTWTVVSADNSNNDAVTSANRNRATGLAWGATAKTQTSTTDVTVSGTNTSPTDGSGNASIQLTDILGERIVTVQASVTIGSQTVTNTQTVTFGAGPLSLFKVVTSGSGVSNHGVGEATWTNAAAVCSGMDASNFTDTSNASQSNLPTRSELVAVSAGGARPAAFRAAGWPDHNIYLTGEVYSLSQVFVVSVINGDDSKVDDVSLVPSARPFVCRR